MIGSANPRRSDGECRNARPNGGSHLQAPVKSATALIDERLS
jgi:hypothetical protein